MATQQRDADAIVAIPTLPDGWRWLQHLNGPPHQAVRDDGLLTPAASALAYVAAEAALLDIALPAGGVCPWPCPWPPCAGVPGDLAKAGFVPHPARPDYLTLPGAAPGLTITPGAFSDAIAAARAYLDAAARAALTRQPPPLSRPARKAAPRPTQAGDTTAVAAPPPLAQLEMEL